MLEARRTYDRLQRERDSFDEEREADRAGREDFEDHLRMIIEAAEGNIESIKEAFVISLYHLWERFVGVVMRANPQSAQAAGKNKMPARFEHDAGVNMLIAAGFPVDKQALNLLRLTANVAKHSSGKSAQDLYDVKPDWFDARAVASLGIGFDSLIITDDRVDEFFEAVECSIPDTMPPYTLAGNP